MLETTNEGLNRGVFIRLRTDGKLFNLARLRAHTKRLKMCIRELLYANNSALVANNADPEVARRIQSTTRAYGALQKRLWSCNDISTKNKVKVDSVAVIPCLLYSIECTTLYCRHIVALTSLQLRHLRCPTSSTSSGKTVSQALRYCAVLTQSVLKPITVSQLRWAGHVRQMANSRLPKAVFYSQLRQGKRSHQGQKLRFKDLLKRHIKETGISRDTREKDAV